MKFAFDTYRDVVSDDSVRRTNALFTFALWFAAGGYITSTILPYLPAVEGTLPTVVGGLVVSGIVAALKTT